MSPRMSCDRTSAAELPLVVIFLLSIRTLYVPRTRCQVASAGSNLYQVNFVVTFTLLTSGSDPDMSALRTGHGPLWAWRLTPGGDPRRLTPGGDPRDRRSTDCGLAPERRTV